MSDIDPSPAPGFTVGRFAARRFDGRSAMPHPVQCRVDGSDLVVEPGERHPVAALRIAEPLSNAPRLIELPGGAVLQVEESAALRAALAGAGHRESRVVAWQRAWPASLVALLLLVAGCVWAYVDLLPAAGQWAADRLPPALEARMGDQLLATLDRRYLAPSKLPAARQAELQQRFAAFRRSAGLDAVRRVEFRSAVADEEENAKEPTVNAFALPGGTIVFFDGIVDFAKGDDEMLLAVLAHEAGHQADRHMTRGLFRALGGVAIAGLLWGDYSSVASNGVVIIGQLHYTRHDEEEADTFAIAALRRGGISPAAMARFFWKEDAEAQKKGRGGLDWLSTHPGSRDRAERAIEAAEEDRDEAASAARR